MGKQLAFSEARASIEQKLGSEKFAQELIIF
jgi:hypothetical protein